MLHLAADPPLPDMGWATGIAGRAILLIQILVTIFLAVRIAGDAGAATAGGVKARIAVKEAILERAGAFIALWSITPIMAILKWVAGALF